MVKNAAGDPEKEAVLARMSKNGFNAVMNLTKLYQQYQQEEAA